jgi:putative transposase
MSAERRKAMVEPDHPDLSITRQCQLLSAARSSYYRAPAGESEMNLALMRFIDAQFLETPWYGSRQMARHLRRHGWGVGRKRVRRLMRKMGLVPIYQRPRTSVPHPEHRVYPYLLRDLAIEQPNQVWCADVTYIPMRRGFLYLVAIMDWASRKVLAWRLSNTMDAEFCVAGLEEALARYGSPAIFNTDQGSQFTSLAFTDVLRAAGVRISMDGRGRWLDNVFIERLWRSLKYECVYLNAFETGSEARAGIGCWIDYYNAERPHSALDGLTPDEAYARPTVPPAAGSETKLAA